MKHIYRWVMLVALIVAMTGCQDKDVNEEIAGLDETVAQVESTDQVEDDADLESEVTEEKVVEVSFGGTLNIASYAPKTFNPILNDNQSVQQVLDLIYEPLFELDPTLKPVPMLVETYEFDDNGKVLRLKLKENTLFHDGTVLTVADVKYTVEAIQDSEFSSYKKNVLPIKRMTYEDDYNMTIYYDQGYAFALNDLTFPIVSKAYLSSDDYNDLEPVGTGPYRFDDYQQMQHLDLIAYDSWHGGKVNVEKIHCIVIDNDASYETLFDQHLIDVMNPNKFNWLKYSEDDQQQIDGYVSSYYDFIGFNFANSLFEDVAIRKAFAYGINRGFILYDRFVNHGVLVESPVIPGSYYSSDKELVYTYDLDKAKSMLPSTLVDKDGDGFFDLQDVIDETAYKTLELKMLVNANNPLRVEMASYIQEDLEKLGFKIIVEAEEADRYYERVELGDFDLLYGGWKLSQIPDYVELFDTMGTQNYIGYSSEVMDMALGNIIDAYTEDQIKASVAKFEDVMVEELPYISMYFLEGALMRHDKVYGEFDSNTESMFKGIENIYLDLSE